MHLAHHRHCSFMCVPLLRFMPWTLLLHSAGKVLSSSLLRLIASPSPQMITTNNISPLLVQAMVNPSTSLGLGVIAALSIFPLSSRASRLQLLICESTSQHSMLSWSSFCTKHWMHIHSRTSRISCGMISADLESILGMRVSALRGWALSRPCMLFSAQRRTSEDTRRFLQTHRCLAYTQQHTSGACNIALPSTLQLIAQVDLLILTPHVFHHTRTSILSDLEYAKIGCAKASTAVIYLQEVCQHSTVEDVAPEKACTDSATPEHHAELAVDQSKRPTTPLGVPSCFMWGTFPPVHFLMHSPSHLSSVSSLLLVKIQCFSWFHDMHCDT